MPDKVPKRQVGPGLGLQQLIDWCVILAINHLMDCQEVPEMATELRVPTFVPFFNRIVQRLLRLGAFMGPNALLTVRGRRTGQPRSTPVAVVEVGGRRWI